MKLAKRILTAGIALGLTLGLSAPAFAATITVNDANTNEIYTAYKLFDVSYDDNKTPGNTTDDKYAYYTDNEELVDLLKVTDEGFNLTFNKAASEDVWYMTGLDDDTEAAALAKYINDSWENQNIASILTTSYTATVSGDSVTIDTDTDTGYFFVTSSMGSLCALNTALDEATVDEKNEVPTVDKEAVNEDADAMSGTAAVGDSIEFTITVTIQPGAENYVLHDYMSTGLTLDTETAMKVQVRTGTGPAFTYDDLELNTNYTIKPPTEDPNTDNCAFEVVFTSDYLNSITEPTVVVVTYNAIVNANAVTGTDPVTNQAVLDYGNNSKVETDDGLVELYNYDFNLNKIDSKDSSTLTGAEFKLYDTEAGATPIQLVKVNDTTTYRVATQKEISNKVSGLTDTITAGEVTIEGLAGKDYWLEETKAPDGYNKLSSRVHVVFGLKSGVPVDGEHALTDYDLADQDVENTAGALLPSTGGMGTTVLYIVGIVLVLGAGITLVVRRRMNQDR